MSKKSNKAQQAKVATTYNLNDTVLGKVRGYPPWPGMVVDPDNVHPSVALERPSSKKATFYCVRFFPMGDHAWLVEKDMSKLQRHEIESYISEPHKKSSELLNGYRIALDPATWLAEKEAMIQDTVDMEENAEIDQLAETEDGEDEGAAGKKQGKKRKRDDASASVKEKKERKKADKQAKAKPKKDADAASNTKKTKATNGNGTSKRSKKSQSMVESEDEGEAEADAEDEVEDDADAGPSTKSSKKASAAADKAAASPPPAKKAKRDRDDDADEVKGSEDNESIKVRDWRHRLQKTFLSNKSLPREEEMPNLNELFKTVENYEGMTIEQLQFSKIGKVMRHIAVLTEDKVPRDDEFKFRLRAGALVERWHKILNANKGAGGGSTSAAPEAEADETGAVNGARESAGVEDKTAAMDLNGGDGAADAPAVNGSPSQAVLEAEAGDTSFLADVTMSEA
ncbi:hypothetical protein K443DRAFT_675316 [Laccaria amethystina LaAM-08-1]|uniref:PWWP domain-containing protein n=1 Tax=Laccaria amethystina LaAM-08-1 TaxID=1095629 RepID=A0A0C9XJD7_9AGAR|nr:hypothetical protein K443DRAFT_675316 [Laccaria amethystina LaAM-08-1]